MIQFCRIELCALIESQSHQRSKFHVNLDIRLLQLPMPYCVSSVMVNIISHVFPNIVQTINTFSPLKFTVDYDTNMDCLNTKTSKSLRKKWTRLLKNILYLQKAN